jgi:hypothetical protein
MGARFGDNRSKLSFCDLMPKILPHIDLRKFHRDADSHLGAGFEPSSLGRL